MDPACLPRPRCVGGQWQRSGQKLTQTLNALDKWHSDKADVVHNFHFVYGDIFRKLGRTNSLRTLEIGMGTNNPHLPSTMGKRGSPGASLRAFRDFLPRAAVHGGDIDRAILFQEDRIRTGFVDQLDLPTLDTLYTAMGSEPFDLIIDDGLHALGANANTLLFALRSVRPGGFVVIEDVTVRSFVARNRSHRRPPPIDQSQN